MSQLFSKTILPSRRRCYYVRELTITGSGEEGRDETPSFKQKTPRLGEDQTNSNNCIDVAGRSFDKLAIALQQKPDKLQMN